MSKIKTRPFDVSNYLNDEADIAAYLQVAIEDGDPALLAAALGDIARARGVTQLARDTGPSRGSRYKSL
ncbi:addiction module antidote protein, partial [Photobacterium phosphoreum]|uniref:addiction module antidote protein n=1 Tax=Photobacterium phosphoreum TaxID=659 RepID=UPI001E43EB82